MSERIYLSPPHMEGDELERLRETFASNWIAPVGPELDAFEGEVAERTGTGHAVAVSSGTAALHLALRLLDVGAGDEVWCSTFTFCASANPILYEGATPVFLDSDESSWNLDPELLTEALESRAKGGRLPRALIVAELYGQCADFDPIARACARYEIPVIEDAAEALGASYRGRPAGSLGELGVFSFNGNKIITTSGGGMLVSRREEWIERARFLSTQARDPAPHYQHSTLGYNYRMSNLLAAVGRRQLEVLPERVAARRRNFDEYERALGSLPGISFMPEAEFGSSTRWLTCLTIDERAFGATRDDVRVALERDDIEARPVWKPLHLQPLFAGCESVRGEVAERIFARGLCLPSGSSLSDSDRARVIELVRGQYRGD